MTPLDGEILPPAALLPAQAVRVLALTNPFSTERRELTLPAGSTLLDCARAAGLAPGRQPLLVWIGDAPIPADLLARIRPKPGSTVVLRATLAGGDGKNPLATILQLAVIVAAAYVGAGGLVELGLATGGGAFAAGTTGAAIAGAMVGMVGSLAINALIPPPMPRLSNAGAQEDPVYGISGASNSVRPYEPVPVILGRRRHVPDLGAQPYRELVGDDIYYRMLFVVGLGRYELSEYRLGDTSTDNYDGVEIEVRQPGEGPHTLFPSAVSETTIGVKLDHDEPVIRTAPADADELAVEIECPRGVVKIANDGSKRQRSVSVSVQYAPVGTSGWIDAGTITITQARTVVIRRGLSWQVPRGDYEIRVMRVTEVSESDRVFDEVWWSLVRRVRAENPLRLPGCTSIALKVKASDQLQGNLPAFSALVHLIAPDYDADTGMWVERATSNPASLYRYVLQAPCGRRPVGDHRLDMAGLEAFHDWCRERGFTYNAVVRGRTEGEILDDVAAAGRAARAMPDGRYGVVVDRPTGAAVHLLTPRNSWGFSSSKSFRRSIHGVKVSFVSEAADWRRDQIVVYADAHDEDTATEFDSLDLGDGITDADLAWKHGRYYLAQLLLRPETYEVYQDIEHVVIRRGDPVDVAHDVIAVGLAQGRIQAVIANGIGEATGIRLDERVEMVEGTEYGIVVRRGRGQPNRTLAVRTVPGETDTLTFETPLAADLLRPGQLVAFGRRELEVLRCLCKGIEPGADMTARLTLVDLAPGIHAADGGAIPPYDPQITLGPVPAPTELRADEAPYWVAGTRRTRLSWWWRPSPAAVEHRVQLLTPEGVWQSWEETGPGRLVVDDAVEGTYVLRLVAIDARGRESVPATKSYAVGGEGLPPGRCTEVVAEGGYRENAVRCRAPSDPDLGSVVLLACEEDDPGRAETVATVRAQPGAVMRLVHGGLGVLETWYYWVHAVDVTGHPGPLNATQGTPATTQPISHADVEEVILASPLVRELTREIEGLDALAGASLRNSLTASDLSDRRRGDRAYVETKVTELLTADEALARQVTQVVAELGDAAAAIETEATARASADSALAQQVSTVQTAVNGALATVQTQGQAIDGIRAQHTIKTQVRQDGKLVMAGIGVMADATLGSEVLVQADRFAITSSTNGALTAPFVVLGGRTWMANAMIQDGAIVNAKIGLAEIDRLRVAGEQIGIVRAAEAKDQQVLEVQGNQAVKWAERSFLELGITQPEDLAPINLLVSMHQGNYRSNTVSVLGGYSNNSETRISVKAARFGMESYGSSHTYTENEAWLKIRRHHGGTVLDLWTIGDNLSGTSYGSSGFNFEVPNSFVIKDRPPKGDVKYEIYGFVRVHHASNDRTAYTRINLKDRGLLCSIQLR